MREGEEREVCTYYATKIEPTIVPYDWYQAFVVAGGREHGLPMEYISELEAVVAKVDADKDREAENFAILDCSGQ